VKETFLWSKIFLVIEFLKIWLSDFISFINTGKFQVGIGDEIALQKKKVHDSFSKILYE